MRDFKIGDYIIIKDSGKTYTTKSDFFEYFGFINKKHNPTFIDGEVGIVFGVKKHNLYPRITILAVQHEDGRQCLINTNGVISFSNRKPFKLTR